jgi:hypothetical protein
MALSRALGAKGVTLDGSTERYSAPCHDANDS